MSSSEFVISQAIERSDYDEAVRLLRPLAEQNSEFALLTLGWIYETGGAGFVDNSAARSLYELAASLGNSDGYLRLGWLLMNSGDEVQARKAFEQGAYLKNNECTSALAQLTDKNNERIAMRALESKDYALAASILRPLAERNSEYALLSLGWICETGVMGATDTGAARSYYAQAAAQGSATGHLELGRLLLGLHEETLARAEFAIGAELGDTACMARLGEMMTDGVGGAVDKQQGLKWLVKASARGHLYSQRSLLDIQLKSSNNPLTKTFIAVKIALLGIKAWREIRKDPYTPNIR